MFTNRFKALVGIVTGVVVAGGLTANQYQLEKQVNQVATEKAQVVTEVITATPTATPEATLVPNKKTIVVTVAPNTHAVVPTK